MRTRATAKAVVMSLVLCVVVPWLAACSDSFEHPDYLSHPYGVGDVWAVNGDRFYVSSGGAVVLWLDGAPAQVIYSPPDRYADDPDWWIIELWGARGELTAFSTSLELRVRDGSEFRAVPNPPGQEPVFYVRDDDMWAVTRLVGTSYSHELSGIFHLEGEDWSLEAEIGDDFTLMAIRGDPDTGLWVAGDKDTYDEQGLRSTPTLLRRGAAGWETVDSTHLGYALLGVYTEPFDDHCPDQTGFFCLGDVWWMEDMWVDVDGRAHVRHRGPGVLVHDGTQSWMEEPPARIGGVEVSPDGTMYAHGTATNGVDPSFLWIHDGTGWQGTEVPYHSVYGLSAFDGGAIAMTCNDSYYPVRVWPDGTWAEL